MIVPGEADLNIRAVFRDTFPSDAGWSETPDYARLGLRVTQTSRSWVDYPFDDLLII